MISKAGSFTSHHDFLPPKNSLGLPWAWSKKTGPFVQVAFICFLSNFQGTPEEIDAQ